MRKDLYIAVLCLLGLFAVGVSGCSNENSRPPDKPIPQMPDGMKSSDTPPAAK